MLHQDCGRIASCEKNVGLVHRFPAAQTPVSRQAVKAAAGTSGGSVFGEALVGEGGELDDEALPAPPARSCAVPRPVP